MVVSEYGHRFDMVGGVCGKCLQHIQAHRSLLWYRLGDEMQRHEL